MAYEFCFRRRIEFPDTDMAGVVYFTNYLKYMEAAEHAFFQSLGVSVFGDVDGKRYGWPRVHVACRYLAPLRFEDEARIRVLVRTRKTRSLELVYLVYREEEILCAVGRMVIVCVAFDPKSGDMRACAIPAAMGAGLEAAPASAFAEIEIP